jgi:predicted GNAT family acetyltransferase
MTSLTVIHNSADSRFELQRGPHLCVADYHVEAGVMHLTHTWVDSSLQGQGIAAALVDAAIRHARDHGLRIHPACSYVKAYMQRHLETQDLLA